MMITIYEYIAVFVIGLVGSGGILFGSFIGLKSYEDFPKKIFTTKNSIIYVLFGGAFAVILQISFPVAFAPLYSLAVGAGWPALVIGLSTSQVTQKIADDKIEEIKDLIGEIMGGQ